MTEKMDLSHPQKTVAIITAAGSGVRMGTKRAKQFLDLCGSPLLAMTIIPFQHCSQVGAVVLVVPLGDVDYCQKEIVERFRLNKVMKVVPGGKTRQDSVRLGVKAAGGEFDLVLIHDGVRPVISAAFIGRVVETAQGHRAVITGLPVKQTVKGVNSRYEVVKTYDRQSIWLIQTPQIFRYNDILSAHEKALHEGWNNATDDSTLIEKLGIPVKVIEGSEQNIKVTTPYDLELARFLLNRGRYE